MEQQVTSGEQEAQRMPSRPRVTVVIPTYNRAHWLGGAIESVLAQSFEDFHLVVSDNASTDGTREVVARFGDARLSYVRQARNLELNEHFNTWFERVDTEYLFILPDDDRLGPNALAETVPVLDANARAGVVHGQVDVIDGHDRVIVAAHEMTGLRRDAVEPGAEFIAGSMAMSYRVHASTALIRSAAVRAPRLDVRDWPLTDLGLWLRLALDWDLAFLARPLARYRIHPEAYSAGAAQVTGGGYIQTFDRAVIARDVKLRFLAEHAERVTGVRALRASARRAFRQELLEQAGNATLPARRATATARTLVACVRLDAAVALEPAAWRLLIGSIIGPRAVSALKRLRGRPNTSLEVTA